MKTYFVYILLCKNQSYYTGITNNLERRLDEHMEKLNPNSYTARNPVIRLVWFETFNHPIDAINVEKKIKKVVKKKKGGVDQWELG